MNAGTLEWNRWGHGKGGEAASEERRLHCTLPLYSPQNYNRFSLLGVCALSSSPTLREGEIDPSRLPCASARVYTNGKRRGG